MARALEVRWDGALYSPRQQQSLEADGTVAQQTRLDSDAQNGRRQTRIDSDAPDGYSQLMPLIGAQSMGHDDISKTRSKLEGSSKISLLQFVEAICFVEESEEYVRIGIMRLGDNSSTSSIHVWTEDGSAEAGIRYESMDEVVVLESGQNFAEVRVPLINDGRWMPTVEFKAHLSDPTGCELGPVTSMRVKVIDNDTFPSSRYNKAHLESLEVPRLMHLQNDHKYGILWEYLKLNFHSKGVAWRTLVVLLLDQMHNLYMVWTLKLNMYLVDRLFSTDIPESDLLMGSRQSAAILLGVMFVLPVLFLHLSDSAKAHMDLLGHSKSFIRKSLIRKYMNFSDGSRSRTATSELIMSVTEDTDEVAEGYIACLDITRIVVKVAIVSAFILCEHAEVWPYIIVLPLMMMFAGCLRHGALAAAALKCDEKLLAMLQLTQDIANNHDIIADYWRRPLMNDLFENCSDELRKAWVKEKAVKTNSTYVPKWLGHFCSAIFLIYEAPGVGEGLMSVGDFLATLRVFQTISDDFAELYGAVLRVNRTICPLLELMAFLNLDTDLSTLKDIERHRLQKTKQLLRNNISGSGMHRESLPISLEGVSFHYGSHSRSEVVRRLEAEHVIEDVNICCQQGCSVAVVGPPDSGKATLMRLLGQASFPTSGYVFLPLHLRILHVTRDPCLLQGSMWRNLLFGIHTEGTGSSEQKARAEAIMNRLEMTKTLELLEGEADDTDSNNSSEFDAKLLDEFVMESWADCLSASEKVRLNLTRALIVNPELMVIQRPLTCGDIADLVLELMLEYVEQRGVCCPAAERHVREQRTVFFSPETLRQASRADRIWVVNEKKVIDMTQSEREECKSVHQGETFLHRFRGNQKQEEVMQKQSATPLWRSPANSVAPGRLQTSSQTFPVPLAPAVERMPSALLSVRRPVASTLSSPPSLSRNGSTVQIPSSPPAQLRSFPRPRIAGLPDIPSFRGLSSERTQ